jgi:hypothetical protein
MTNFRIVNQSPLEEKLLQALFLFLGLKGIAKGFIIGSVLVLVLVLASYSLVADALCEVTSHIGQLWTSSDSLTRLFMLCLAVYVIRKVSPYIMQLHKGGIV